MALLGQTVARTLLPTAALAVVLQACGSEGTNPPDTTPAAITIVSGDNQTAQVGTALGNPLVVRVTNAAGGALNQVTVNWSVLAGGGTLGSATSTTNAQGQAQITYTVGAAAGANQMRATVEGAASLTATFSATANAVDNTPAVITVVSGDNQSAFQGQPLGSALVVRVANATNQALQNITVSWTVTQGGGTLGSATSTTDAQGQASNTYTVGGSAGANQVQAAVQSNTAINTPFNATAQDATPAVISIVSGNNQSATVGQALPSALVVRVANASNQAIPTVTVSWTVVQGGGTLGAATSNTNGQGQASNTYTVGAAAGPNQVRAAVQANATINTLFDATASAVATTASVDVTNFQFTPPTAAVAATGTVTWNFNQGTHNVTWVSGGFTNSGDKSSGTYQVQFPTAGTFQYYCSIHGSPGAGMHGTITVQ
jgi:adhesin/invasin